jgi:hypothetical protein
MPWDRVVSVSLVEPFAKFPLAPDAGAAKITVTPFTGDPALVTTTENFWPNAVPTAVFCWDPFVSDNFSDAEEDDEEFEPQPESRKRVTKQAAGAKPRKALRLNCAMGTARRLGLQTIAKTPAGVEYTPQRLMTVSLLNQTWFYTPKLELGGTAKGKTNCPHFTSVKPSALAKSECPATAVLPHCGLRNPLPSSGPLIVQAGVDSSSTQSHNAAA